MYLETDGLSEAAKAALLADAVETLYQGIVITDPRVPDNPIVFANDAFLRLTGYRRDDIVGFNCRFLQGSGTDSTTVDRLRGHLAAGTDFFGELLNYRRDGTPFWNALSIKPLRDATGAPTYFVASQTDVTPLKDLQVRADQQQRLELLGTFAGGIAHDFNNVLLAAGGHAELLSMKLDDPGLRDQAQQIVNATATGRRLTEQLLSFSKGDRGAAAAAGPIDVALVAAETVALAGRLFSPQVEIALDLPDAPALVRATHSQLEQVVLNLLVNARDALEGRGRIAVTVAAGSSEVVLTVADDGCGIPAEVRERIFESFFSTKGPDGGTGLGLATVSSIVTELRGSIDLESTVGVGTSFRVALPALA